ncbi:MAG: hypothetical protein E7C82_05240 [Anaerococcus hydrogenalis]|uniref:hypothetical protein n=1 Tax=Anaerococcus hydrogenalis TaxID=33029 RepID=UPI0028FDCBA9|nr:hypothetical protein [Anaerococcus hydrogenalis]MDU2583092.1 hypothetical protein [Anaerococcus hydrogenalis]
MNVFLINSKNHNELKFIKELSNELSKDKSLLLLSFKRNKKENIEDLFDMAGMITYDICDYFLEIVGLDKIIRTYKENIDFAISPLVEDKYDIKKEDIDQLFEKISNYDYLIIYGLDSNLLENKKEIKILNTDEIESDISSDYFYIENDDKYFDIREKREEIINKSSKFLGLKTKNNSYDSIISNLLEDKEESIGKIGFFEKLKKKLAQ